MGKWRPARASRVARDLCHEYKLKHGRQQLLIILDACAMLDFHMACCMPYTINTSIIHIIIQYLFILKKFSVINLLQKNNGSLQTSTKMYVALGKKRVPNVAHTCVK